MSILLLGGHERMCNEYLTIGKKHGHKIKNYPKLPPRFTKSIGSPDVIVLFTNTVSHKMMCSAVKQAKKKSIPVLRCTTGSVTSLEETLQELK